jgi:hypothetical protein
MANERAKYINSRRRHRTDAAIARQVRIARQHGVGSNDKPIKEPHRHAKHHAMDCGQPGCMLCGNPRRILKEKTIQEQRQEQDVDQPTDRHSNGLNSNE